MPLTQETLRAPEPATHPRAWAILALILCAEIMDLLDSTIVNIAAPDIAHSLHSSTSALQWVTGGYSLAFAVFLITGARLGDRFGRRTLFLAGAYSFVLFSAVCALAANTPMLVTGRLLQGTAAALLVPQGMALLQSVFSPADQGRAFSVFGPVVGLAAVAGPVLGGILVSADLGGMGWRLVFVINVPIGIATALGAARLLPREYGVRTLHIDTVGTLLVGVAATLFIYPLIQGREAGRPAWTYASLACGAATLALFALWTRGRLRRGRQPLLEPGIFAHRGFTAGVVVTFVFFAGSFGLGLALTLFLQLGLGFTPLHAGLTALPLALGSTAGAFAGAATLAPRLGRKTLQLGALVQGAGQAVLLVVLAHTGAHTSSAGLIVPLLLIGTGIGLIIAPLFDFVLASLSPDQAGSGSGVLNALQQLGTAVGVAALGTVFFATANHHPHHTAPAYTTGLENTLFAGIVITAAVAALTYLLPRTAREEPADTP